MPAKQKRTKRMHIDPNYYRPFLEAQALARRRLCTALRFWQACGHKPCRRARACARATNDCFKIFWPLVPERLKISIRAAAEAKAAGQSGPEIAAAIERAQTRWDATQAPLVADDPAPQPVEAEVEMTPPRPSAAPAPSGPRARMI